MKRNRQEKELRRQQKKNLRLPKPLPTVAVKPKKWWQIIIDNARKILIWFGLISAPIIFYFTCRNETLSSKDKYEKENIVQGDLKPSKLTPDNPSDYYTVLETPPIINSPIIGDTLPEIKGILLKERDSNYISFMIGNVSLLLARQTVSRGIKLNLPIISKNHSGEICFGIKDDRLYVNVEFKDLLNEKTIGWIEYNHWKVFTENMGGYPDNDDTRLEVRDKQRNIVFSFGYQKTTHNTDIVVVSGYFVTPLHGVSIIASNLNPAITRIDTCILATDSNYKAKVYSLLPYIKTIFPK